MTSARSRLSSVGLAAARKVKHRARQLKRRTVDRSASVEALWRTDLPVEVRFWRNFLRTGGADWPDDYKARIDPLAPLAEPLLTERLDAVPRATIEILDVGAGPLTSLGKVHPGGQLAITAVDPLSRAYDGLLTEAGIEPCVRTQECAGEDLVARFGPESFDVAYARNSLDHTVDPVQIVANMLEVVRPGGFVALRHYQDEGASTGWVQLHQWNFNVRDGELVVWGRDGSHNLSRLLADRATVRCWIDAHSDKTPWVLAVLTRLG